jgi:hypothetical protein
VKAAPAAVAQRVRPLDLRRQAREVVGAERREVDGAEGGRDSDGARLRRVCDFAGARL